MGKPVDQKKKWVNHRNLQTKVSNGLFLVSWMNKGKANDAQ